MGSQLRDKTKSLRAYLKRDADFSKYNSDSTAQEARQRLLDQVLTECVIVNPNWDAAARPWESGCPFEAYLDASDESWCVALCQRPKPRSTPRLVAFICKVFSDEATRWSAFGENLIASRRAMLR